MIFETFSGRKKQDIRKKGEDTRYRGEERRFKGEDTGRE